ncbi:MAG: hypothetical protein ACXWE4_05010 [Methylobacter sp.]
MSEFKENLKKVERLLMTAQICGEYTANTTLYDFLGIDKTATKEQIKASIDKNYKFYLSMQYVSGWKTLTKEFISSRRAIESLLCECRPEYDNHLIDLSVKELRNRFVSLTHTDRELNAEQEKDIIKEGMEIGLSETQIIKMIGQWMEADDVKAVEIPSTSDSSSNYVPHDELSGKTYYELFGIPQDAHYSEILRVYEKEYNRYVNGKDKARWDRVSDGWEILKDSEKREAYDKKINEPKPEIEDGTPVLKVICKMDGYLYKDVKKGVQLTETIVIKNDHKGQLQGKITSDAEWLVPERGNFACKSEQTLNISILTAKIPENTYDAKGTVTLETNGGPPCSISFRVTLDDFETAADRFRKTYVPLAAACAGFIGSFSRSPFLYFLISAIFTGILFYSIAKLIVKPALKNGLNILKLPSNLVHSAAAGVVVLAILSHSFGSSATKQAIDQEKLDMSSLPEKPYAPATPQAEQPEALPEAEKNQVMMDRNQQFIQTDDIPAGASTAFSDSLANMDSKAVGAHIFREFYLESIDAKARYGFGLKTQQNPLALYFQSQDWDFVPKSPKKPRCNESPCPLAGEHNTNVPNTFYKPRLANGLKNPSIHSGYVTASRIDARLASSTAKSKKWKPKTSSFAPPSRDDL